MKKIIYCSVRIYIAKTDAAARVTFQYADNTELLKYIYFDHDVSDQTMNYEVDRLICYMANIPYCDCNGIMQKLDLTVNQHASFGDYADKISEFKELAETQEYEPQSVVDIEHGHIVLDMQDNDRDGAIAILRKINGVLSCIKITDNGVPKILITTDTSEVRSFWKTSTEISSKIKEAYPLQISQ